METKIPFDKIELWLTKEDAINIKIFMNDDDFNKYSKILKDKEVYLDLLTE